LKRKMGGRQIKIQEGDPVTLKVGVSGLIVKAIPKRIELDDLLLHVTPENLHAASDWGAEIGHESYL
jgi:antitoxin component of MazEF toxin-antitoxin module